MLTRKQYGLSKSKIAAFEQCAKRLWLQTHARDEAVVDAGSEQRFATGNMVGTLAQELHDDGIEVLAEPDLAAAVQTTQRLIDEDFSGPIFEATFLHDGVLVRADVLERADDGGWAMAEVKSSTSVKDYHRGDLATQIWVLRGAGVEPASAAIRHIDKEFVLQSEGEFSGLLVDSELMDELESVIAKRAKVVKNARKTLKDTEPDITMGPQCNAPFDCEFQEYCGRDLPDGPQWPLEAMPSNTRKRLEAFGTDDLMTLDATELDDRDAWLVEATQEDVPYHDVAGATAEIADWGWPRAWIDFETINPAVPMWVGTRPYQQIPFQYSLHLEHEDGTIEHSGFLSLDGKDPRPALAKALLKDIPKGSTLIAYNAGFERRVLKDLAIAFPKLARRLKAMEANTVDLLPVTKRNWYHRDQWGSWSIKAVLPTISQSSYATLEIKDGGNAQEAYLEAISPQTSKARRTALAGGLNAYCKLDTWAMVEISRHLTGAKLS